MHEKLRRIHVTGARSRKPVRKLTTRFVQTCGGNHAERDPYRQIAFECAEPAAGLDGLSDRLIHEQHPGAQQLAGLPARIKALMNFS